MSTAETIPMHIAKSYMSHNTKLTIFYHLVKTHKKGKDQSFPISWDHPKKYSGSFPEYSVPFINFFQLISKEVNSLWRR